MTHKIVPRGRSEQKAFDNFYAKIVNLSLHEEDLLSALVKEAARIKGEQMPDFDLRATVDSVAVRDGKEGKREIIIEESACWSPKSEAWDYAMSVYPELLYAWNSIEYGNREFLRNDPNGIIRDDESVPAFFLVNDNYDGEDDTVEMYENYATEKELVDRVNELYKRVWGFHV